MRSSLVACCVVFLHALLAVPPAFASSEKAVVSLGRGGVFHCSGVVVAPHVIVTASHCLPADQVRVGPSWASSTERHAVIRGEHHPDRRTDAAVLIVGEPVSVEPAPILAGGLGLAGEGLEVVGFGAQRRGRGLDDGGRRVSRLLFPTEMACNGRRASVTGCRPGQEWLIAARLGEDTCTGDSGGGVFGPGKRLVAIVSRGVLNGRRLCGDGGIYVRVDVLWPWLRVWLEE